MNKKQIEKQLRIANNILNDIKKEYAKKSLKYGKFAYEVQNNEINRLNNLMKKFLIVLCLFMVSCKSKQQELDKEVSNMFEFIECPAMGGPSSKPVSASN